MGVFKSVTKGVVGFTKAATGVPFIISRLRGIWGGVKMIKDFNPQEGEAPKAQREKIPAEKRVLRATIFQKRAVVFFLIAFSAVFQSVLGIANQNIIEALAPLAFVGIFILKYLENEWKGAFLMGETDLSLKEWVKSERLITLVPDISVLFK